MSYNIFAADRKIHLFPFALSLLGLVAPSRPVQAETFEAIDLSYEPITSVEVVSDPISSATPETATSDIKLPRGSIRDKKITQVPAMNTSVFQLTDAQPTNWAFQTLQFLIRRYDCLAGYPDSNFQINAALTRFEFATGVSACLNKISQQVGNLTPADLTMVQRLQDQFAAEHAVLRDRVENLQDRTKEPIINQLSTTTRLSGQKIFAVTGGSFSGERIVGPTGAKITSKDPDSTFLYRKRLDSSTSFNGKDLLKIRLHTGDAHEDDNIAGLLEPTFGSVLDFSAKPSNDSKFKLGRLYYTFTPFRNFTVSLGPAIASVDYVDRNSYANLSFLDFSTQALVNNYILLPIYGPSAGAVIDWKPRGPFTVRAVYVAADPGIASSNNQIIIQGLSPFVNLLYPNGSGSRGLFGDPYQGTVEVEYFPSKALALRLQYSSGQVLGGQFNVFGANFELAFSQQLAVFGRYGYSSYQGTAFGNINPSYWMAGVAFRGLFRPSAFAGVAASQPFIENAVGNATQTNFEAFYNFPLSDTIRVTPLVQVILDPANQSSNGTIVTGTLRTVFSF